MAAFLHPLWLVLTKRTVKCLLLANSPSSPSLDDEQRLKGFYENSLHNTQAYVQVCLGVLKDFNRDGFS